MTKHEQYQYLQTQLSIIPSAVKLANEIGKNLDSTDLRKIGLTERINNMQQHHANIIAKLHQLDQEIGKELDIEKFHKDLKYIYDAN